MYSNVFRDLTFGLESGQAEMPDHTFKCIPPDEYRPIKPYCMTCKHHQTFINNNSPDFFIKNIIENKVLIDKNLYFTYPTEITDQILIDGIKNIVNFIVDQNGESVDINKYSEKDKNILFQVIITYLNLLNEDILSQYIYNSKLWHDITRLNICNVSGESNAVYWNVLPFKGSIEKWSIAQKKISVLTLIYETFSRQYTKKDYCLNCYLEKEDYTGIEIRQKKCEICKSDVSFQTGKDNRFSKYLLHDRENYMPIDNINYSIHEKDWQVLSVLSYIHGRNMHYKKIEEYHKRKISKN